VSMDSGLALCAPRNDELTIINEHTGRNPHGV
jgi:hypothetical protein